MYQKNIEAFQNLKNQSKPKGIIFDWDNTLVDTWPLIHEAINETMRKMGHEEWSFKKVKDTIHKAMRDSFPEIFGDDWQKAGEIYVSTYRSINLEKLRFLPGALDLINAIYDKKIPQFVVSNKIGTTLRKEVKALNVKDKFFAAIGSMDADKDKPQTSSTELALNGSDLSLNNKDIWFVGDTLADVDCAYNCGFQPIIFGHDFGISKIIPPEIYENGREGEGAIPVFFKHEDVLAIL